MEKEPSGCLRLLSVSYLVFSKQLYGSFNDIVLESSRSFNH